MGTNLINYEERFAAMAKEATSTERVTSTGRFMSTKSGVLSFMDEAMPGNQIAAVILDSVYENTYYPNEWQAGKIENPLCYAFARNEDDLEPYIEGMQKQMEHFEPQAESCTECAFNEWGSSPKGKGKACQQRRRLYMIPAGFYSPGRNGGFDLDLFDNPSDLEDLDAAMLKVPVTSTKNWAKYVHEVSREYSRPPMGVFTRVYLEPDAKSQFQVRFEVIDLVPDHMLETIFALHEQAKDEIITEYYYSED
ncbi:MAG: hypothetical protein MJH10_14465 [Epibacterium sp.]|nr:hypothetical protein [Epibacterium sp.]NQX74731.1 hypothetical protein [Epibacterium sp.]